jgi:hypothetical protein
VSASGVALVPGVAVAAFAFVGDPLTPAEFTACHSEEPGSAGWNAGGGPNGDDSGTPAPAAETPAEETELEGALSPD